MHHVEPLVILLTKLSLSQKGNTRFPPCKAKRAGLDHLDTHTSGSSLDNFNGTLYVDSVEVRHLELSNFLDLRGCNLTNLVPIRFC